jgi:hypothetical protein
MLVETLGHTRMLKWSHAFTGGFGRSFCCGEEVTARRCSTWPPLLLAAVKRGDGADQVDAAADPEPTDPTDPSNRGVPL